MPREAQPIASTIHIRAFRLARLSAKHDHRYVPALNQAAHSRHPRQPASATARLTQQLRRPLQDAPAAVSPNQRHAQTLLTVISAPAGYGKSTRCSPSGCAQIENAELRIEQISRSRYQFSLSLLTSQFNVAWLSLDAGDNDLQQFWRYVVAALQTQRAGIGPPGTDAAPGDRSPPPIDDALAALLDGLQHTPCAMVLVLDDYHVIDTPAIHDLAGHLSRTARRICMS